MLKIKLIKDGLPLVKSNLLNMELDVRTPYSFSILPGGSHLVYFRVSVIIPSGCIGFVVYTDTVSSVRCIGDYEIINAEILSPLKMRFHNLKDDIVSFKRGDIMARLFTVYPQSGAINYLPPSAFNSWY